MLGIEEIAEKLQQAGYDIRQNPYKDYILLQKHVAGKYQYILLINNSNKIIIIYKNIRNLIQQLQDNKTIQKGSELLTVLRNNGHKKQIGHFNGLSYSEYGLSGITSCSFFKEYQLIKTMVKADVCIYKRKMLESTYAKYNGTPITYILIFINILFYFLIKDKTAYGFSLDTMKNGEYWTLFSYMFMHSGILHIILNMIALYIVGTNLEYIIGHKALLFIYIVGGIYASFFSLITQGTTETAITVGASGSIFSLVGAFSVNAVVISDTKGCELFKRIGIDGCLLATSLLNPFVNNWCHIGGYVAGIFLAVTVVIYCSIKDSLWYVIYDSKYVQKRNAIIKKIGCIK